MSEASWYYASNGSQQGPFTFDQMKQFVTANTIHPDTQVWPGKGNWVSLKDTELGATGQRPAAPPPLAAAPIDNRYVWALIGGVLAFGVLELLTGKNYSFGYLGLCIRRLYRGREAIEGGRAPGAEPLVVSGGPGLPVETRQPPWSKEALLLRLVPCRLAFRGTGSHGR